MARPFHVICTPMDSRTNAITLDSVRAGSASLGHTTAATPTTQEKFAFTVFERTVKEFGLPLQCRKPTD
jgi:hypothetical protein